MYIYAATGLNLTWRKFVLLSRRTDQTIRSDGIRAGILIHDVDGLPFKVLPSSDALGH